MYKHVHIVSPFRLFCIDSNVHVCVIMVLDVDVFDPTCIKPGSSALFVGPRHASKSTYLKHVMSFHMPVTNCVVVNPTEEYDHFYESWLPDSLILTNLSEDTLSSFVESQRSKRQTAFLILDKCFQEVNFATSENLNFILMNSRQLQTIIFITMPYPSNAISPIIRSCIDYVFIFKYTNIRLKRLLYVQYASMFKSFKSFEDVVDTYTENGDCIVIDHTKIKSQVFRFGLAVI